MKEAHKEICSGALKLFKRKEEMKEGMSCGKLLPSLIIMTHELLP